MKETLLVFAGGGAGSVLRYLVGLALTRPGSSFPLPTLLVNLSGSLLIGLLLALTDNRSGDTAAWRLLLVTGFCGGFTTFSAFSNECILLLRQGQTLTALSYIAATLLLGLAATLLGYFLLKP